MTDFRVTVTTDTWSLESDTSDPYQPGVDPNPHRWLLDGLKMGWAIEFLPPVAQPSICQFQIYDDGQHPDGWLPIVVGQVCRVNLHTTRSATEYDVAMLSGRMSEPTAQNHPNGGVVYNVVVTDMLGADLAADTAPESIVGTGNTFPTGNGIATAYDNLRAQVPFNLEYETPAGGTLGSITDDFATRDYDATNQSVLDVLNMYAAHDIRLRLGRIMSHWVQVVFSNGNSPDPDPLPGFQIVEYDPQAAFELDSLMELTWDGAEWIAVYDTDYYDTFSGMLLYGSDLLSDVGSWRQLRSEAINRVELTGLFQRPVGADVETVRASHKSLVQAYGANTRSLASPCWYKDSASTWEAEDVSSQLLGELSQVQQGFGLEQTTLVWDQLTDQQIAAWAEHIWPCDYRQAYGRPLAIVDVQDSWRLVDTDVVFGRLMGVEFQASKGQLFAQLAMRNVPASTVLGATFNDVGALSPTMTIANTADSVTLNVMSITHT